MPKRGKPQHRQVIGARVVARKHLSPNFVRITIGDGNLGAFVPMGFDQWFRLFLPNADGVLRPPTRSDGLWVAQYMLASSAKRPIGRNYTVREYRADGLYSDGAEIDIDFALHEDDRGECGPATDWAKMAAIGDELAILDEGITYRPELHAAWELLAGDETALPAIAGILRSAPRELRAEVFIEIPHLDDAQDLEEPSGVNVHWLPRSDGAPNALDAVRAATLPDDATFDATFGAAFVAGGQKLATGLRRHLVNDRRFPKQAVTFVGYWR